MQAWLDAVPEKAQQPRRQLWSGEIPDPGPASFLCGYLAEVGPIRVMSAGWQPLHYSDLLDWQRVTAVELSPWCALAIVEMSRSYYSEAIQARDQARQPPYAGTINQDALIAARKRRHGK